MFQTKWDVSPDELYLALTAQSFSATGEFDTEFMEYINQRSTSGNSQLFLQRCEPDVNIRQDSGSNVL